jgi:hypothetical protein
MPPSVPRNLRWLPNRGIVAWVSGLISGGPDGNGPFPVRHRTTFASSSASRRNKSGSSVALKPPSWPRTSWPKLRDGKAVALSIQKLRTVIHLVRVLLGTKRRHREIFMSITIRGPTFHDPEVQLLAELQNLVDATAAPITADVRHGVSFPISVPVMTDAMNKLVGVAGFEPATPSPRTWCAPSLHYPPPKSWHVAAMKWLRDSAILH